MYIIRIWTEAESRNVNLEVKKREKQQIFRVIILGQLYDIVKMKK